MHPGPPGQPGRLPCSGTAAEEAWLVLLAGSGCHWRTRGEREGWRRDMLKKMGSLNFQVGVQLPNKPHTTKRLVLNVCQENILSKIHFYLFNGRITIP